MSSFGHSGSAPSPFDAINGGRLAGGQGSHPLHGVRTEELLNPGADALDGRITIDRPAMVGEPIRGTLELTAREPIEARSAHLRLLGLRLVEQQKSESHTDANGHTTSDSWVEANGRLFSTSPFLEPAIPATLAPGKTFSTSFAIPGPALGPPTAHLGEAIVAWAIEVRFDIPRGFDAFIATLVPIAQHPNLLAAGVGAQGGLSMLRSVDVDGGTISIESDLPAVPGSNLEVAVSWPEAPGGNARIELHRRSTAPNGVNAVMATAGLDAAELSSGSARVSLPLPSDLAPSFDGADLQLMYVVRVLVDRRFMPDTAIERLVAIT
jgi:hypothetical protein